MSQLVIGIRMGIVDMRDGGFADGEIGQCVCVCVCVVRNGSRLRVYVGGGSWRKMAAGNCETRHLWFSVLHRDGI